MLSALPYALAACANLTGGAPSDALVRRLGRSFVGLMNTAAQVGGLAGSLAYGYIVQRFGSYDAPFVPMAALLCAGALLWLKVDATVEVQGG
jgi:predicted MFS family arabinose efflux permease